MITYMQGRQHWLDLDSPKAKIHKAAWGYPETKPGRKNIEGYFTFATGEAGAGEEYHDTVSLSVQMEDSPSKLTGTAHLTQVA